MPTFEEHCRDTERHLGHRYDYVHRWLDELQPTLGPDHRRVRHNPEGVAYCRQAWGEEAGKAAQRHIDLDENSHEKKGDLWVPKNEPV
jgi:hypothetical protein